jgi:hypothetical protein
MNCSNIARANFITSGWDAPTRLSASMLRIAVQISACGKRQSSFLPTYTILQEVKSPFYHMLSHSLINRMICAVDRQLHISADLSFQLEIAVQVSLRQYMDRRVWLDVYTHICFDKPAMMMVCTGKSSCHITIVENLQCLRSPSNEEAFSLTAFHDRSTFPIFNLNRLFVSC